MDRFNAMSVLVRVVRLGSLSAAAKEMAVPLSTVSRRISELEAHLGTRVLNRSSRRIGLTDAGQIFYEASKEILDRIDEAERAATGLNKQFKGQLVVTAPLVLGRTHLVPVLAEFLATYPEIDLKLILADRLLDLLEVGIDVALRIGILPDSSMIASRIGTVRRVTCASPAYLNSRGRPMSPTDLRDHVCVTFDNLASPELWRFSSKDGDASVTVRSRLTVTTAEAALAGAVAGLGLTRLLSYQIIEEIKAGRLEVVLADRELEPWPVSFLYAPQRAMPGKLRAFLDFVGPRLRDRLREDEALL